MSTAQAANGILTTMDIKGVMGVSGNRGPQWQLQCRWPWSNPNQLQFVDTLWLEQSDYPEQPGAGLYEVEVAMVGRRTNKDQEMYDGSRYWMHKYKILRLLGPTNQMNLQPDFTASVDGYVSTGSNGHQGGGTPSQPTGASRYTKDELIVRQVAAKGAFDMICAQIVMPEAFDELLEQVYRKIMGYTQAYLEKDMSDYDDDFSTTLVVTDPDEPAPPAAPPAPAPPEHFCEVHGVGYNKYSTGYMHQVAGTDSFCLDGIDGLYDEQGNPVEAMV